MPNGWLSPCRSVKLPDMPGESNPEVERPRVCVVIDEILAEAIIRDPSLTHRAIAAMVGISEMQISRWRRVVEPTLDQIAELESAISKPPGYILVRAGYIASDKKKPRIEDLIRADTGLSDAYQSIMLDMLDSGRRNTKRERARQREWSERKQRRN